MIYCNKSTSVLFARVDREIQVYRCRLLNLLASSDNNKETQLCRNYQECCVGRELCKVKSVGTGTDSDTDSFATLRGEHNSSESVHNTSNQNTMSYIDCAYQNWEPSLQKGAKLSKLGKQSLRAYDVKKKHRRKKREKHSRGTHSKPKKTRHKTKKETPQIHNLKPDTHSLNESQYDNKIKTEIYDTLACSQGICEKAVKKREKGFYCACKIKRKPVPPPVECIERICNEIHVSSDITLKERVIHLYRRSLQKLGLFPKMKCKEGLCIDAQKQGNHNISCVCKQKIKKCTDETCKLRKKKETKNQSRLSQTSEVIDQKKNSQLSRNFQKGLTFRNNCENSAMDHISERIVVQNEIEQTGDPFFEIKVNAVDMCVLNPSEIKQKVIDLGERKKRNKCVCPSHHTQKKFILEKDTCLSGACRKALKNKKTDFTCKCLKNKILTCSESTCNRGYTEPYKNSVTDKLDKPLFEVQVDHENMCIINTEEMQKRIHDIHSNKICDSGICRDRSEGPNVRIQCKCRKPISHDECTKKTCDVQKKCKCRTNNHKSVRANFNTASLRNVKSKFFFYCSRMCSKSDNLFHQNKRRSTRNNNRRIKMNQTQSDNAHKRRGVKFMVKSQKNNVFKDNYDGDCCACDFIRKNRNNENKESDKEKTQSRKTKTKNVVSFKLPLREILSNILKSKCLKMKKLPAIEQQTADSSDKKEHHLKIKMHERNGFVVPIPSSNMANKPNKKVKKIVAIPKQPIVIEEIKKVRHANKKEEHVVHTVKAAKNIDPLKKNVELMPKKDEHSKKTEYFVMKRQEPQKIIMQKKLEPWKKEQIIKKKQDAICLCQHSCECAMEVHKWKARTKSKRKSNKRNIIKKKKKDTSLAKKWQKESKEKKKQMMKEERQRMRREKAAYKKRKKEEMEVLKLLESEEGGKRSNCCVEILGAILSAGFFMIKTLVISLFKVIVKPKKSFDYIKERLRDPEGTFSKIEYKLKKGWRIRRLKICKCFKNSETANVLGDTFKESTLYQAFADKGKTKKEQQAFEIESRRRRKRVSRRNDAALYGCRHVLLTTLRKTPCIWVYHVCPEFYPQCLSCLAFLRSFWHVFLFMCAFVCWTPCIVLCELTRSLWCCLLCTG